MPKRILITGSNGLLGQKLVALLADNPEFELLATSQGVNRISSRADFSYQSLDITNKAAIDDIFAKFRPEILINTAAMTNVDQCESEQEQCRAVNVSAVEYFIEACRLQNTHFIHLSTDFVFDGEAGPYSEEDQPNPLSFYGQSKYDAELLIQKSGLNNWTILRTIIVYGVAEEMSRSNIVLWAKGALEKGQDLKIVDDQFRSPTLAEDLARGCVLAAEKRAQGIYHISGKDQMSILELVQRVARFFNLDHSQVARTDSASLNQAAKRPARTGFILDKANRDLGYDPKSFEEGLEVLRSQLEAQIHG